MEIKKLGKYLLPLIITYNSHAGLAGLTHHSRANCVNNESISWWAGHNFYSRIIAYHNYGGSQICLYDTFKFYGWRNAAVHWGEAPKVASGDWNVYAYHIMYSFNGYPFTAQITNVNDCSIYNGWWDR